MFHTFLAAEARKLFLQQRDPTKINALGILALYLPWFPDDAIFVVFC